MKTITAIAVLLLIHLSTFSQDLTGTWKGGGGSTEVKIVLVKHGDQYIGYTYDRDGMGFCKTNFTANFDTASKRFRGKSVGFIDHSFMHAQTNYNLRYSVDGDEEILKGHAVPKSAAVKIMSFGIAMPVMLTKLSSDTDTTSFMLSALTKQANSGSRFAHAHNDYSTTAGTMEITGASETDTLALIAARHERTNNIVETITTSASMLVVKMYDNGVEDGDSISILHNDKIVQHHVAVRVKPIVFQLLLNNEPGEHVITLVAHNLGSIPPNTAMIEINADGKTHVISASADMHKNAVIKIQKTE
ncbi:hypothetical protein [Aridibaculum aurantiacum]|uniref:hypothetical protein n=1 Tax=Aridibaculum aurantiacum TaxID=2810307 RepID=UPI001A956647|nr:hypothetical protein [Aridibaculum aurantiacum]